MRFDLGSRALYAADGSNYREVPIGVVLPRDVDFHPNTAKAAVEVLESAGFRIIVPEGDCHVS